MNANEIVQARELYDGWIAHESMHHGGGHGAKSDDGEAARNFMMWLADEFPAMCDELAALKEAQRWIPVSERLPESRERVLVSDGKLVGTAEFLRVGNRCGYVWSNNFMDITHWMPRPALPREQTRTPLSDTELDAMIYATQTNADFIRSMSDEDLAEFLDANRAQAYKDIRDEHRIYYDGSKSGWLEWLRLPAAPEKEGE